MKRFLQALRDTGYRQFYLAFGDANLRHKDWALAARGLSAPLLDLVKLFLLVQPVPLKRAILLLGQDFVSEAIKCGILSERSGNLVSNAFLLIVVRGHTVFCQKKQDTFAYFGEDSLALASYQTPAPGGYVLDLCSGPGTQSFIASTHAAHVTGVEIRKETWRIAEINRRLNGAERVQFVNSSAEDFARDCREKFDRIMFNPPLVPIVPGYKFAFVGDGGGDGLDVTRRIVSLYHDKLAPGGLLEFIGLHLMRKGQPMGPGNVLATARKHDMAGRIHYLSRHTMELTSPMFQGYAWTFAQFNGLADSDAARILAAHFKKLGADAYWFFFASLHKSTGPRDKHVEAVDVSGSFWGLWFV